MDEKVSMGRDWQPWAVVGLVALAIAGAATVSKDQGSKLSDRTATSGWPLTAEQRSVRFDTADLTLEVQPERQRINGRAALGFTVVRPIARIQFDLDPELPIRSIAADGRPLDRAAWDNAGGLVTVTLPSAKRAGDRLALVVDYGGRPHVAKHAPWDGGFVWARTKDGQPWVATAVEGEGCDLFWPCFDNSLVEVGTVTQHIIVPEGLSAPSNGRLLGVDTLPDGRSRWNWRAEHPNNYAIAIDVAPYRRLAEVHRSRFGNAIPIDYWYLPGEEAKAKALFAEFGPTIDFFEAKIGPYPFGREKVGVVETPHLGMEHQTINAYGNAYKPAAEGYDWLFNHEFSHEWFGNQLTNRDFDDMWLHEGFGTYMQALTLEWLRGDGAMADKLFEDRKRILNRHPMVTGHHRSEHEAYDDEVGSGTDIYFKGALMLHTLRHLIGDDAFYRATRRLVYGRPDPRPGNFTTRFGTTDEFVAIASQEAHRDLKWFFDVYLRHAALPRLVERRSGKRLDLQWRTPRGLPFPMPVELRVDGKTLTVPMTGGRGSVALPADNSLVTIDPGSFLLRQDDAVDCFRDWTKAEKAKTKG